MLRLCFHLTDVTVGFASGVNEFFEGTGEQTVQVVINRMIATDLVVRVSGG